MFKVLAAMEMKKSREEAAMYRAKAEKETYLPGKADWLSLAELCEKQAFMWECASL